MSELENIITLLTILGSVLGIIITLFLEFRKSRKRKIEDALMNKILPYYALIIELIIKIDLKLTKEINYEFKNLKIPMENFYKLTADSFLYIQNPNSRQLLIDILKISELLNLRINKTNMKEEDEKMMSLLVQYYQLLMLIKDTLNSYIKEYSRSYKLTTKEIVSEAFINDSYENFLREYYK
ncbi:MAG: hypothetical protein BAJALOKI2v1_840008 [Promethearchaeota archaeon]|nr:MAG: hypothetical protein BAJALOKI2v1_840008 [Candidatus Lokiarchaeota archaeon]